VGGAPVKLDEEAAPAVLAGSSLHDLLRGGIRGTLERVLPAYLTRQRWFRGKARKVRSVSVVETVPMDGDENSPLLSFVRVDYTEGDPETYVLPLALSSSGNGAQPVICGVRLRGSKDSLCLVDAVNEPAFVTALLELIRARKRLGGAGGSLVGANTPAFRQLTADNPQLEPAPAEREQSNTSIAFGDRFILKLYRKLEEGVGLDLEVGQFLTSRGFPHSPAVAGAIDYRRGDDSRTVAVLHAFARNEGDAWEYTLDHVNEFFERAAATAEPAPAVATSTSALLAATAKPDGAARERIGTYIEDAILIGRRTAELHNTLGTAADDPSFTPEPFTGFYQRSMYQSMRNQSGRVLQLLEKKAASLEPETRALAQQVHERGDRIMERFREIISQPISAVRIRWLSRRLPPRAAALHWKRLRGHGL
jgi:maltose alpha-D-glucosyltransferase/alpha-amylase